MKKEGRKPATLRTCASCEWVFKMTHTVECPRCGFGTYGAHFVYGDAAYRYAKTQKPWKEKRLAKAMADIHSEAQKTPCCWTATHTRGFHHDSNCPNFVMCY